MGAKSAVLGFAQVEHLFKRGEIAKIGNHSLISNTVDIILVDRTGLTMMRKLGFYAEIWVRC